MEVPHPGSRTEEHFKAAAPRKNAPLHILPIEWRVPLCPLDKGGKERPLEQRTAAAGIRMRADAIIVFGRQIQDFENASGVANCSQAGFFPAPRGISKVDL